MDELILKKVDPNLKFDGIINLINYNFKELGVYYSLLKISEGEKGDDGLPGLSIKGDGGEKGDPGSSVHYVDNIIINGTLVTNPEHLERDTVIDGSGKYRPIFV
jgi:hypothetical protein